MMSIQNQINMMAVFALALLLPFQSLSASAPRDQAAGDALRRAQQMLQTLAKEKSELEGENIRLSRELESVQKELTAALGRIDKTEKSVAAARNRNEALTERIRSDSDLHAEMRERFRAELDDAQADIKLLLAAVGERTHWIGECQAKNDQLQQVNVELLEAYKGKTAWDSVKQREPVTGLAAVKIENQIQEYEFRLEDLRTIKFDISGN
jgi:peptidoglycan hydrolase CwlO-like protein